MTTVSFLCLGRDAGRTVWDLCFDLATLVRPGDEVLWIDDTGTSGETATWLGRFHGMVGWPPGVRVDTIVTGTRGAGDTGIAVNQGLCLARGDLVLVLPGRARLDAKGVNSARDLAMGADLVICPWDLADPDQPQGAPMPPQAARLPALLFRRALLATIPVPPSDEGCPDWGEMRLLWALHQRAALTRKHDLSLGRLPPPPPRTRALFDAAAALSAQTPGAVPWIVANLPLWLANAGTGAVSDLLQGAADWSAQLSRAPDAPDSPLMAALRSGDADAARREMRGLCQTTRPISAPARSGTAPIRLWLEGPHTRRTPFAYPALTPLWDGRITLCDEPAEADLVVCAHPVDMLVLSAQTADVLGQSRIPAALISEEPFWDSLFSPDPLASRVTLRAAHLGGLVVHQVNHHRSPIFDFARIPYFLLTDPGFIARYRPLFARNATRDSADWQTAFANRAGRAVFMAERRPETFHDIALPRGDLLGLCAWRTRLAETYGTGVVDRLGASWQGGPTRFDMPDWHRDKIAYLDGHATLISALENTHQPNYISEKLFDAFACGARPLYMASPGHRVHDLGLPAAAWINLWGLDSAAAPSAIDTAPPFAEVAACYATAQRHLAALFHDDTVLAREHARLGAAVLGELVRLVDLGPA